MPQEKNDHSDFKPGSIPEMLKLDGNWEALVKKSLVKKKPAQGWPKPSAKKKGRRGK